MTGGVTGTRKREKPRIKWFINSDDLDWALKTTWQRTEENQNRGTVHRPCITK